MIPRWLLLVFFSWALLPAQTPVFHADTNLQTIAVRVTDKRGVLVPALPVSAFALLEDGRPQKIAFFGAERQPISLAILIDTSRSMDFGGKLARARAMLAPIVRRSHADDEIFVMAFTDRAGAFVPISPTERGAPIPIVKVGQGGSALYDAVATALCRMRTASNLRQAIVVLTDGVDEHSRLKLAQLLQLISSSRPQVFLIGFYDQPEYQILRESHKTVTIAGLREIDNPLYAFDRLAKESGAEAFFPRSDKDLEKTLNQIYTRLQAQYTLAYYPRRVDIPHRIDVRVKQKGVNVSARVRIAPADTTIFRATGCEVSAKEHPFPWESRLTIGPGGARTYHEDFSNPQSGWPNFRFYPATRSKAHYISGGYEIYRFGVPAAMAPPAENEIALSADTAIAAYGPWWKNFRATLLFESQSYAPGSSAGLVTSVNEGGYYALLVTAGSSGKQALFSFVKGTWNGTRLPLIRWTALPAFDHPGKIRTLSVESRDGHILLQIDGKPAGTVYATGFGGGLVGFGVFGDSRALIRDLRVQDLL